MASPEKSFVVRRSPLLSALETVVRTVFGRIRVPTLAVILVLLNWENFPFVYTLRTAFSIYKAIFKYVYLKQRLRWFSGAEPGQVTRRDESELSMRNTFAHSDYNFHANNGSYNLAADLSRCDLMVRSGLGPYTHRNKLKMANGGVVFAYIKEIPVLSPFTIRSSFRTYDRKWFVLEHRVESADGRKVYAIGHSRIVVKERSGKTVPPQEVLEGMRKLGLLHGWGEAGQDGVKDVEIRAPPIQECCRAVLAAEKALEMHALEEELEHKGKGWEVGTVDGGAL
ncbi:HotDog domain-containing protein [Hyaloraphidium curvatum]|nr:HotDog domain-containing protein [Hyaloraphidium curvatum]